MSKITDTQKKILVEAMRGRVDGIAHKLMKINVGVATAAIIAAQSAVLAQQISSAQQAGASFEQLLCLIYDIKE